MDDTTNQNPTAPVGTDDVPAVEEPQTPMPGEAPSVPTPEPEEPTVPEPTEVPGEPVAEEPAATEAPAVNPFTAPAVGDATGTNQ